MTNTAEQLDKTEENQGPNLDDIVHQVATDLELGNPKEILRQFTELEQSDQVDLLEKLQPEDRLACFQLVKDQLSNEFYTYLDRDVRDQLLSELPADYVATIITDLDSDDAITLIQTLNRSFRREIIGQLSRKTRSEIEEGLTFPKESAGRMMQRTVLAIPQFWTVGKALDYIKEAAEDLPETFWNVFLIGPDKKVTGYLPTSQLLKHSRTDKIIDLGKTDIHTIPADMDREDVAHMFRRTGMVSMPVIDSNDQLMGAITLDDVLDAVDEEAQEDTLKLGGVGRTDIYRAAFATTRSRFLWLAINLATAILASIVIGLFEGTLNEVVALAILMPIVASMGGNAGTQTLTVAVRAIATKQLTRSNASRVINKETLVGFLNGLVFALCIGMLTYLWFDNIMLGSVIGMAMIVNLVFAGLAGAFIPIALDRMGLDPALASTVLLTTVTDLVGFFGFLGLASLFLL